MSEAYLPILLLLVIVGGLTGVILYLARVIGPSKMSAEKGMPFESGIPNIQPHRHAVSVRFYLIAILFIVFDLEVIFLYPWAVLFQRLGLFGFVEMMIFVSILAIGLAYAWKKGALEWD